MDNAIRCLRCEAENRSGRRFCAGCGAALPRPCHVCGFINHPDERFCGGCGGAVETPAPPASPPATASAGPAADASERRQVTILFADLSGYTSLAARRDPEETHRILGRFFEAVDHAVARYGGSIERHIGDNVMGVFGAPVAHGDDPYRAVEAARAIHHAVGDVSAEIGIALSVHIGIAAGTVMASSTGSTLKAAYGVVGSPVNLAARLQAQAQGGETLISDAVKEAVERLVGLEPLGEVPLKGLDTAVRVWRVTGARAQSAADAAMPLVGRRAEIAMLKSILDEVAQSRHGAVIYIRGEAGIGKTRLTQVLAEEARARGFSCHVALILDFGMEHGRDATRALLASALGLLPGAAEADRRAAATRALERGLAAPDDMVFLADLLDLPQAAEQRTLYDAMDNAARNRGKRRLAAALLSALTTAAPMLLVVEDLHWAEPNTLENLAAVAESAGTCPLILAMTSRIEADPLDEAWRARVRGGITSIDLGPLRPSEASELARRLRIENETLLARCIERSEGNPLFLDQLLRHSEEGAEDVPASVQSLVLARMDRLDARDKAALQAASVAGQRFSLDLVRAVIGSPEFVPSALLRNHMIRPDGAELLFAHALVREGVYSSITHERRRALHHAAARWYAERDAVLCAEHLERASDPGAAQAYAAAARAQALEYHYDRALALAKRGRALAAAQADAFALDTLQGEYLREAGRAQDSLNAFELALSEAGDAPDRCRAHIGIAAANRLLSRTEPALAALTAAQPLAQAEGLVLERSQIHYYRGNIFFAQGDAAACLAEHQAALAAAERADSNEWRARALSGLGDAHYSACRMGSALEAFVECVSLCDACGYGRVALPNRIMTGHCLVYQQRASEAVATIAEARRIALHAENPHTAMFATQSLGVVLINNGQPEEALQYLPDALAQARALGARRYESNILSQLAECALLQGRRQDALALAAEAVAISRELGMGFNGPYALAVLARATDDASLRAAALAEGESVLRKASVGHNLIWYYRTAGDAHVEAGNWPQAQRCAHEIRAATSAEPLPLVEFIAARLEVLAAVGRGERGLGLREASERLLAQGTAKGHHGWLPSLARARDLVGGAGHEARPFSARIAS